MEQISVERHIPTVFANDLSPPLGVFWQQRLSDFIVLETGNLRDQEKQKAGCVPTASLTPPETLFPLEMN